MANNKFGNAKSAMIQVFSLSNLIAIYPKIAEDQPIFCCDIKDLCTSNYERYQLAEKFDIAKAWSLIKISLGDINSDLLKLNNWAINPMGKGLVMKLLMNFQQ